MGTEAYHQEGHKHGVPNNLDAVERAAEDQTLLKRWRTGDNQAFEEIFRKYQTRVYSVTLRLTRSVADAEDLTAETFARAYSSLANEDDGARVLPWLYRVAVNLCRDLGRRRAVRKTYSFGDRGNDNHRDNPEDQLPDNSPQPLELAVESEMRKQVAAAIGSLPEPHREVILLFYLEGKSLEEVSKALNLRAGTVKSRLSRARDALRKDLSAYLFPSEGEPDTPDE